jgi:glyoxylase-like metal-dependent hydrolase (beta-lactamase superfamily II)
MIFRQLLDPETSTWTYLLGDGGEAILIDPVLEQLERDRTLLAELSLRLVATLETHVHADHVTGGGRLREALGSRVVVGAATGVENADVTMADGERFAFGGLALEARATPGHTAGCTTFVCHARGIAFTGDTLLIRGCGRTDFQQGDAHVLFESVRAKIFTLPDETLLYPGHDYRGRTVTTVAEEKAFNPRLGLARSEDEFVGIMAALDLAYPKRIDVAVPANLVSGLIERAPAEPKPVAAAMEELGRQDAERWQGMGI